MRSHGRQSESSGRIRKMWTAQVDFGSWSRPDTGGAVLLLAPRGAGEVAAVRLVGRPPCLKRCEQVPDSEVHVARLLVQAGQSAKSTGLDRQPIADFPVIVAGV